MPIDTLAYFNPFTTRPYGPKGSETLAPYVTNRAYRLGGNAGRCGMRQWSIVRTWEWSSAYWRSYAGSVYRSNERVKGHDAMRFTIRKVPKKYYRPF